MATTALLGTGGNVAAVLTGGGGNTGGGVFGHLLTSYVWILSRGKGAASATEKDTVETDIAQDQFIKADKNRTPVSKGGRRRRLHLKRRR